MIVATLMTIKVMVIDTGYLETKYSTHKVTNPAVSSPYIGHGTSVVAALLNYDLTSEGKPVAPVCNNVQVTMCGMSTSLEPPMLIGCLDKAIKEKFDYVNISYSGSIVETKEETLIFKKASEAGIVIAMAAGNQDINLDQVKMYPQEYARTMKGVYTLSAFDVASSSKSKYTINNYSGIMRGIDDRGNLKMWSGTSFAAPRFINQKIREKCLNNGRSHESYSTSKARKNYSKGATR
jgi:subtilisin family serine protease